MSVLWSILVLAARLGLAATISDLDGDIPPNWLSLRVNQSMDYVENISVGIMSPVKPDLMFNTESSKCGLPSNGNINVIVSSRNNIGPSDIIQYREGSYRENLQHDAAPVQLSPGPSQIHSQPSAPICLHQASVSNQAHDDEWIAVIHYKPSVDGSLAVQDVSNLGPRTASNNSVRMRKLSSYTSSAASPKRASVNITFRLDPSSTDEHHGTDTAGTALLPVTQHLQYCPICYAQRDKSGRFEIQLEPIPRDRPTEEKIQYARQTLLRYKHHGFADLSRASYAALRSLKCILKCYYNHCRGAASEFQHRHSMWGFRSFYTWQCSGNDKCDYIAKSKQRLLDRERKTEKRKGLLQKNTQRRSQRLSSQANSAQCGLCGLVRNQSGRFFIPSMKFANSSSWLERLQLIRQKYESFSHHTFKDLQRSSYDYLLSLKYMLVCYDHHCEGNITEFQKRHPTIIVSKFRTTGCSGRPACNYQQKTDDRRRMIESNL